ncbi:unnamed protein product, partial [Brassica oleracea]
GHTNRRKKVEEKKNSSGIRLPQSPSVSLENPTRTLQAASCQKRGYFRPFQPKEIELRLLLSLIG